MSLFPTAAVAVTGRYAVVALEQGLDATADGLTYAIPATLADVAVGQRVTAPLGRGNKPVAGYVVRVLDRLDEGVSADRIKPLLARDEHGLSLPAELIDLARWIAAYYVCPLGMVLVTMLPAAVKKGTGSYRQTLVTLPPPSPRLQAVGSSAEPPLDSDPSSPAPAPAPRKPTALQLAILAAARDHGEPIDIQELALKAGAKTTGPIRQLIARGELVKVQRQAVRAVWDEAMQWTRSAAPRHDLTPAQAAALDRLAHRVHTGFGVYLLHGVTGSGKTEVYLRAIEQVVGEEGVQGSGSGVQGPQKGKEDEGTTEPSTGDNTPNPEPQALNPLQPGAIVLVPEIALTPQTAGRFYERFGPQRVAVLHSKLTAAQRHQQWQRIRSGQASIVVGARSAVFAPLPRVGILIVDEEHDTSYKQDQLPRYHARDVAIRRAQLLGVPVVLGSATPSLESYLNAAGQGSRVAGRAEPELDADDARPPTRDPRPSPPHPPRPHWHYLHLPDRVANLKLPGVEIVDLTQERRKRYEMTGKAGVHLLSLRLEHALRQTLDEGGQAMLLLNRRGFANYIACPDQKCGWLMTCDHCDATMVYHKDARLPTGGVVRCHHCEAEQLLPTHCPQCARQVTVFGLGTQRVEDELAAKFPLLAGEALLRMDSDTMRAGQDYQHALDRFRRGEVRVLLGTQMIAKGLDFPNVRLVGVVSADTALNLPDFRAAERTFQLIAQVAGRAGRGDHGGRVVLQTFNPHDPAISLAAKHDYAAFAAREIALRAQVGLPPVGRMARIVCRDRDLAAAVARARALVEHLQQASAAMQLSIRVRGPAPCPIARIAEHHRQQVELLAPPPEPASRLQKLMTTLRNSRLLISDAHTAVDVDPVALL